MSAEASKSSPREIILVMRSESSRPDPLVRIETIAKIGSLIAVPVILAVVGWLVQDRLATQTVSKDYVQLAVSILTQKSGVDPSLRAWAGELLNSNSPTKFSETVETQLKTGQVTLPLEQTENMRSLALTYARQGDYAKAENTLREALAMQEREFGPDHPATAATIANLAAVLASSGKVHEAQALYERAYMISLKMLGPDHLLTARLLTEMASVYEYSGDFARAKEYRERADATYRKLEPKPK